MKKATNIITFPITYLVLIWNIANFPHVVTNAFQVSSKRSTISCDITGSVPSRTSSKSCCTHHSHGTKLFGYYDMHMNFIEPEADFGEILAGGQRYEMVELPDSMLDTTIFVGNLCEFVTDDMLSKLFQEVSTLKFVPACVARKPNMTSLKYGFVTFPTVTEKEAAILKFTGYVLNDKKIKVEEIIDYKYRVKVPEKLVQYTVGRVKRTKEGGKNTMRKVSNSRDDPPSSLSSALHSSSSSSSKMKTRMKMSSSSFSQAKYSSGRKKQRLDNQQKKLQSSKSSSMFGSDVAKRGGGVCKNMKRKENRKHRRNNNISKYEDFGLR